MLRLYCCALRGSDMFAWCTRLNLLALLTCLISTIQASVQTTEEHELQTHELKILQGENAPLEVFARMSPAQADTPQAVVIISHGLGGGRHGYAYISEAWARAGFVVLHLQHRGSDNAVWEDLPPRQRMAALKKAANANQAVARLGHVTALLDQLPLWNDKENHPLFGRLNVERVALVGHSFGSVTTLTIMGQNFGLIPTLNEPRIKAGIALSPSPSRTVSNAAAFGNITQPTLCVTGTKDTSVIQQGLSAADRQQVFAALPAGQAYQLVYYNAQHGDFADGTWNSSPQQQHVQESLIFISIDFLRAYLLQDTECLTKLKDTRRELNDKDVWQWK